MDKATKEKVALSKQCILRKDFQQAIETLEYLSLFKGSIFEVNLMLALCYKQTGQMDKAKEYYVRADEIKPGDLQV